MARVLLPPLPPGEGIFENKRVSDPIFDPEGVRVAVFDSIGLSYLIEVI
jgi:hypothetical protein